MFEGIIWALFAGLMLGLYALPGKFTKDFKEENTWSLFFMLTMFVVPILATLLIMKGVGNRFASETDDTQTANMKSEVPDTKPMAIAKTMNDGNAIQQTF